MRTHLLRRAAFTGALAALAAASLMAGCGGSNDDQPAVTDSVPASASQNVAGFIAYLQDLVVASADTLEPVDTSALVAPTDDAAEPVALN